MIIVEFTAGLWDPPLYDVVVCIHGRMYKANTKPLPLREVQGMVVQTARMYNESAHAERIV